jgi:hypothetical protein
MVRHAVSVPPVSISHGDVEPEAGSVKLRQIPLASVSTTGTEPPR